MICARRPGLRLKIWGAARAEGEADLGPGVTSRRIRREARLTLLIGVNRSSTAGRDGRCLVQFGS